MRILLGILATAFLLALSIWIARKFRKQYPPGPQSLPLVGSLFSLYGLAKPPWIKFTEWRFQYGPVVHFSVLGQSIIILNTAEAAYDLLVCRGSNYSDRPRLIMAGEILAGGIHVGFVPFGPLWRKLRKSAHLGLNNHACEAYFDRQENSAINLIKMLLSNPSKWDHHIQRSSVLNMFSIIYRKSDAQTCELDIVRVNHFMDRMLKAALPGTYIVDLFPILGKLPPFLAKFKREGMEAHAEFTTMFKDLISNVKDENENLGPSFSQTVGTSQTDLGLTDPELWWLCGAMLGGGSDTTAAALVVFVLAMIHNPNVMQKAQAQIDAVVGRDRPPSFSDRANLPYISALMKETLRWRPITPLGLARRTTRADIYGKYVIPAGALVLTNVWAMNHDDRVYARPEKFIPERYLDADGVKVIDPQYTRGGVHAYGFGRRVCAGLDLANDALFINIATLLWAFEFSPQDANILPSLERFIDTGVVVRPETFPCKITPRDEQVQHLVELASAR